MGECQRLSDVVDAIGPGAVNPANDLRQHRFANEKALHLVAFDRFEEFKHPLVFNPLGAHRDTQVVGQAGDGSQDLACNRPGLRSR